MGTQLTRPGPGEAGTHGRPVAFATGRPGLAVLCYATFRVRDLEPLSVPWCGEVKTM